MGLVLCQCALSRQATQEGWSRCSRRESGACVGKELRRENHRWPSFTGALSSPAFTRDMKKKMKKKGGFNVLGILCTYKRSASKKVASSFWRDAQRAQLSFVMGYRLAKCRNRFRRFKGASLFHFENHNFLEKKKKKVNFFSKKSIASSLELRYRVVHRHRVLARWMIMRFCFDTTCQQRRRRCL